MDIILVNRLTLTHYNLLFSAVALVMISDGWIMELLLKRGKIEGFNLIPNLYRFIIPKEISKLCEMMRNIVKCKPIRGDR